LIVLTFASPNGTLLGMTAWPSTVRHPESLTVTAERVRPSHGGRQAYCPSSRAYHAAGAVTVEGRGVNLPTGDRHTASITVPAGGVAVVSEHDPNEYRE
jgi:hypothetical protein